MSQGEWEMELSLVAPWTIKTGPLSPALVVVGSNQTDVEQLMLFKREVILNFFSLFRYIIVFA